MNALENISAIIKEAVPCNKARADLVSCFIVSLIKVRTVNLVEIAAAMPGKAVHDSKYRRLKRFFEKFEIPYRFVAFLIVKMLPETDGKWDISMDRTNWKLGEKNINPLVLGIVRLGVAFPVAWTTFSKMGNSNTEERIRLIDWFVEIFGSNKIGCLYADREFVGEKWMGHLLTKNIHFCIRIRENFLVSNSKGGRVPVKNMFRDLKPNRYAVLPGKRWVNGLLLHVVGMALPNGERLVLVTDENPGRALENYKKRWGIETLFQCLKKRGFNFENTRMTFPERIDKLIALLAVAFAWCHIVGEWRNERRKIKIKKHGRKETSIFRYGLDYMRQLLLNFHENRRAFHAIVKETLQDRLLRNPNIELSQ